MNNKLIVGVMAFGIVATTAVVAEKTYTPQPNKPPQPQQMVIHNLPLVGTEWVWLHIESANGDLIATPEREKFVLTFSFDGKLQSTTDCNTFSGTYIDRSTTLTLGTLGSTKKACPKSSLESVYAQDLARVQAYQIAESRLMLTLADGKTKMVFEKK